MKTIKVIHKHKKECGSLQQVAKGWWDTPWWLQEIYTKGENDFLRLICNSTDCKGELRVLRSEIEKQFNDLAI